MSKVTKAFKNGHYYSVDSAVTGHAPTHDGVAWPHQPLHQLGNQLGYSATITSQDENSLITSLFACPGFKSKPSGWLGDISWTGSNTDGNSFSWADPNAPPYNVYFRPNGANTGYAIWYSGGPNNHDGNESSLETYLTRSGTWNDSRPGRVHPYYAVELGQNNGPFMLSFSADVPASIIAGEGDHNSNVIITLNNAVYGDYSTNSAPLIGIPISLGGSAASGKDYPMTAIGGQSFFVHNHFINASHLYVFGNGSSSGISNEDLAILPISTNTWSGLKDASITPGADLSTCNIYSLDATTSHAKSLYKSLQQPPKWGGYLLKTREAQLSQWHQLSRLEA